MRKRQDLSTLLERDINHAWIRLALSHIATPEFLLCGFTLVLIVYLRRAPRNSIWSRALALLCGCLILADDLSYGAVFELAYIAFVLCWGVWNSNDAKSETTVVSDVSQPDLPK